MPRRIAPLSDMQISKAKPKLEQYALRDGGGLYLVVTPSGGKLWRLDYRFENKRLTLAIGAYPSISLADARERRLEAQKQIASGVNPSAVKKVLQKAVITANSFEAIAREWHAKFINTWVEKHGFHKLQRLESNIFPWVGATNIAEVTTVDLLHALRIVENRGAVDLAHRIRTTCVQVFDYAIATGRCGRNTARDLKGALPPAKGGHHAAITEPAELGKLLKAIEGYNGHFATLCMLKLLPMFFCRPGELRQAEWVEFDFTANLWNVPAGRMKMKFSHIVPLCKQAVTVLNELRQVTGHEKYLFPSQLSSSRPMSDNTVNTALRRMGYSREEVTAHGFRATARTILDEVLKVRVDLIEHQLAHAVRDTNGRAYNRTTFIDERRDMMQIWADYLESLILS